MVDDFKRRPLASLHSADLAERGPQVLDSALDSALDAALDPALDPAVRPPEDHVTRLRDLMARIDAGETTLAAQADELRRLLAAVAQARGDAPQALQHEVAQPSAQNGAQNNTQNSTQNSSANDIFDRIASGRSEVLKLRRSARLASPSGVSGTPQTRSGQHRDDARHHLGKQAMMGVGLIAIIAAIPAGLALLQNTLNEDTVRAPAPSQFVLARPATELPPGPASAFSSRQPNQNQDRRPGTLAIAADVPGPNPQTGQPVSLGPGPDTVRPSSLATAEPTAAPTAAPVPVAPPSTPATASTMASTTAQDGLQGDIAALAARAEAGDIRAQYDLGLHYLRGTRIARNDGRAAIWLTRAAEAGLTDAQYNLAVLYNQGQGVDEDSGAANRWFRQAADQGHARAQYALGVARSQGKTLPQDHTRATEWFNLAADQGLGEAMYALAVYAEQGLGQPADLENALAWYRLAGEYGVADAGPIAEEIAQHLDTLAASPLTR